MVLTEMDVFIKTGIDFMIFKNIFAEKNAKKLAFFTHNKAKLCKNFDHNISFLEKANFFGENWQK
jgi:hypothetical protein